MIEAAGVSTLLRIRACLTVELEATTDEYPSPNIPKRATKAKRY
jgi:hypothetical protein